MSEQLDSGLAVRVLDAHGTTVGMGALVGPREILTCAHVVNAALVRDSRAQDQPVDEITVGFAGSDGPPLRARVQRWLPPPRAGATGDDIAGLVLTSAELPPGASPARLASNPPARDQVVDVFGYPGTPPRPDGAWVTATVRGQLPGGRHLQLDSAPDSALRIQPGFSGARCTTAARIGCWVCSAPRRPQRPGTETATRSPLIDCGWPGRRCSIPGTPAPGRGPRAGSAS